MPYADRNNLVTRFTEQEISALEDLANTGIPDSSVSATALNDAIEEADSYIAVCYPLPLPSVPPALTRAICDIARYRLYKDRPTDEVRLRYTEAISWLKRLADGKAVLVFPAVDNINTAIEAGRSGSAKPASGSYQGGLFSDEVIAKQPAATRSFLDP